MKNVTTFICRVNNRTAEMSPSKIHREGADLKIAIKALATPEPAVTVVPPAFPGAGQPTPPEPPPPVRTGVRIERAIRRVFKPIYRPITRFFTSDIRREMRAGHERLSSEIAHAASLQQQDSQRCMDRLEEQAVQMQEQAIQMQRQAVQMQRQLTQMQQQFVQILNDLHHLSPLRDEVLGQRTLISGQSQQIQEMARQVQEIARLAGDCQRRVCVPCGDNQLLIKTRAGFVLCAASDLALVVCLLEGGDLEPGTRLLIERFLESGSVFVDVGANIGMHTMAAARVMRHEGRIFAFEPFGPVCGLLEKTVWMNGCAETVEVHRSAASNRQGRRDLFLGATSGHHSLFPLEPAGTPAHGQVSVETVTLDGTLPTDLKVDLLKIDAEGAELDVIEGARDLINRHFDIALIVEFGPSHLKRAGHSAKDWLGRFAAHGLIFRAIHPETGALEDRTPAALENEFSINLFFARDGSKAWGKLVE